MRLYLSKEEGILLQYLLLDEIMNILNLSGHLEVDTVTKDRERKANDLFARIDECLWKQKSGYNRKDKKETW